MVETFFFKERIRFFSAAWLSKAVMTSSVSFNFSYKLSSSFFVIPSFTKAVFSINSRIYKNGINKRAYILLQLLIQARVSKFYCTTYYFSITIHSKLNLPASVGERSKVEAHVGQQLP